MFDGRFLFDFPNSPVDLGQVLVIADGETPQGAEARARAAVWAAEHRAPRLVARLVPEVEIEGPATDIRGKEMINSRLEPQLLPLPSRFELLERVNFHPGPDSVYTPVGIGQGDPEIDPKDHPIWAVQYAGRFEWLVFEHGQPSRSREEAIKIVRGLDRLRVELLWMGPCALSPHERDELRRIQRQL